ncbi:MAG: UvrB/UvrC motif-containing protein [Kiritimatiellaeota bacterium]|nr:UvrB/UvrC motif-containing protein [Kiritimatiellota bacterium]
MLCQHCHKRKATETVSWYDNGAPCELSVCAACAKAMNGLQAGFSKITGLLLHMVADAQPPAPLAGAATTATPPAGTACPVCGMTLATLQETHRFGCPACYDAFPQEVETLLSEMQYGDIHIGKTPSDRALYGQIKTMRKRLKEAVKENDFTLAAQLRDRIHEMEINDKLHSV